MNREQKLSLQSIQNKYIKLELWNNKFQIIGELSGVCIDGSLTIDANSAIRRTGNIQIAIKDKNFEIEPKGNIWMNRYIKLLVGIEDLINGNVVYTNCGLYIIDAPSYNYDATNNTLNLTLLDLMARLSGERYGYIKKLPIVFKAGESIRECIIATLELAGVTKYVVEQLSGEERLPNDLKFSEGTTYYDVLDGLKNIYGGYEIFFDVNGVFTFRKVPSGENYPIGIDNKIWNKVVISEDETVDFQNVKNSIEVFGRIHEPVALATKENVTILESSADIKIPSIPYFEEEEIYAMEIDTKADFELRSIRLNDLEKSIQISKEDGNYPMIYKSDYPQIYCFERQTNYSLVKIEGSKTILSAWGKTAFVNAVNQKFNTDFKTLEEIKIEGCGIAEDNIFRLLWLGHLQARAIAKDENPNSPFYIKGETGEIYLPLYDGDYANCLTDDLALERAEYELYLHTTLNKTVDLTCIPMYWLDVDELVEYKSQRSGKKDRFLIKNINVGLSPSATMTVNMVKEIPKENT